MEPQAEAVSPTQPAGVETPAVALAPADTIAPEPQPVARAPVPVYEPLPRSRFELNAARMFGRTLVIGGVICLFGGASAFAHYFGAQESTWQGLFIAVSVVGSFMIFAGASHLISAAPDEGEAKTGFVASGRLGMGAALMLLGVAGRIVLRRFNDVPPEIIVPVVMLQIIGPILMAWASYATFILDSDQFDTGVLLIVVFLALEPLLFLI